MTKGKRILCIDDKEQCEIITFLLQDMSDKLIGTNAETPGKALDLIENQAFDLFILESRLPGIGGEELCRRLRSTRPQSPILFYSGMSRPVDRGLALAAGGDAYLLKPDELDGITETVRHLLHLQPKGIESKRPGTTQRI